MLLSAELCCLRISQYSSFCYQAWMLQTNRNILAPHTPPAVLGLRKNQLSCQERFRAWIFYICIKISHCIFWQINSILIFHLHFALCQRKQFCTKPICLLFAMERVPLLKAEANKKCVEGSVELHFLQWHSTNHQEDSRREKCSICFANTVLFLLCALSA